MKKNIVIMIIMLCITINVKAGNTSVIALEMNSGRILFENNAYEKRLIASTTKIMTFLVAYENGQDFLDVHVEAGEEILKMYGTSIYLNYKEAMPLRDLLYGLMLRSGNDAAVVIANFIAGSESEFVKLMNDKAQKIGMYNTVFNNPHGLDEETKNYSTAYDMALLSSYANKNDFYKQVTSTKYYKTITNNKAYSWTNRNKLLFSYSYLTSGKTGYTPSAGKTFVSSASKNSLDITIVSLNDNNHYETHRFLYDEMFEKYQQYTILSKNNFSLNQKEYRNAYIEKDITYPLTEEERSKISYNIVINEKDNIIGYVDVNLGDKKVSQVLIYNERLNEPNEKLSLWQKIKFFLHKSFG